MDLARILNRDSLTLIKKGFKRQGTLSDVDLTLDSRRQITIDVFVKVMIEQLTDSNGNSHYFNTSGNGEIKPDIKNEKNKKDKMIKMLCQLFDSVDADSMGYIVWEEFTTFCLQSGKNNFLPTIKNTGMEYIQTHKMSSPLHGRKLYYSKETSMLFVFEAESASLSYFRTCGNYSGKYNVVKEIIRYLKLNKTVPITYNARKAEKLLVSANLLKKRNFVSANRGSVLCMASLPHYLFAFSTSDALIVFCKYEITSLNFIVVGHCECDDNQVGMMYSTSTELLMTWPGDASDHSFRFWDTQTHQLKFIVSRNKDTILDVCEVNIASSMGKNYVVSSSIDRKVTLWSVSYVTKGGYDDVFDLKGHHHALRSLVFAKAHGMIIGAGFDFDFYGWDINTREMQMKFHGHIYSVLCIHLIEIPNERIISLDEYGYLKVWSLDRDQGTSAGVIQSLLLEYDRKFRIEDFSPIFRGGLDLAFLVDKGIIIIIGDHHCHCHCHCHCHYRYYQHHQYLSLSLLLLLSL